MCKNDPKLSSLPDVLQDLVLQFAFNMPKDQVLGSLRVIMDIVDMKLPFFFFRQKIWSWHCKNFLPKIGRAQSELQSQAYLVCRLLLEKQNVQGTS